MAFLTSVLSGGRAQAQEGAADQPPRLTFLPSGHHFAPLRASVQEPRIGLFSFFDASGMKIDIGNSIDILALAIPEEQTKLTLGIDFMAYAYALKAGGLQLQIDAIDGIFGGNISFSKSLEGGGTVEARLRGIHHSAHLVDGHYLLLPPETRAKNPVTIPFTKNSGELTLAHSLASALGYVRFYGGAAYAGLVRPDVLARLSAMGGVEVAFDHIIDPVANQPTNLYVAYHVSLAGTPVYQASHQVQAGVKFGRWREKGPSIYVSYYAGNNMFSEYFYERTRIVGAGFTVDFF